MAPQTILATWNPKKWEWPEDSLTEMIAVTASDEWFASGWAVGARRSGVSIGDRVFLLKQGQDAPGIVASGFAASEVFEDTHFADRSKFTTYIHIDFDAVIDPADPLPLAQVRRIPEQHWSPQGSGIRVNGPAARQLERLWKQHLQRLRRGVAGLGERPAAEAQGMIFDASLRKRVEDFAQYRLTRHFESAGWRVEDERTGNPFDAIATKDGRVRYLEAKGTTTFGKKIRVTRGEVEFASSHQGECILGIVTSIRLDADGAIEPGSGSLRLLDWRPEPRDLTVVNYLWSPRSKHELRLSAVPLEADVPAQRVQRRRRVRSSSLA